MSRKLLMVMMLAALWPSAATAEQNPLNPAEVQARLVAEVQRTLVAGFAMVDVNRDGYVTVDEFRDFTSSRGAKISPGEAFAGVDRNGDGRISRQEFLQAGMASYLSAQVVRR